MSIIKKIHRKIKLHKKREYWRKKGVIIKGSFDVSSTFEGNNRFDANSIIINSRIGYSTYAGSGSRILNATIGRFCCIGRNLDIIFAQHPLYNCISIHPNFYSQSNYSKPFVHEEKFSLFKFLHDDVVVEIGNDVWIGDNVTIMGGKTIGDGAVLAAGSVITKDVEAYCIVGGNPARVIGKRFPDDIIRSLLDAKWWDNDIEYLQEIASAFYSQDKTHIPLIINRLWGGGENK